MAAGIDPDAPSGGGRLEVPVSEALDATLLTSTNAARVVPAAQGVLASLGRAGDRAHRDRPGSMGRSGVLGALLVVALVAAAACGETAPVPRSPGAATPTPASEPPPRSDAPSPPRMPCRLSRSPSTGPRGRTSPTPLGGGRDPGLRVHPRRPVWPRRRPPARAATRAEFATVSADGLTWTLRLRDDVRSPTDRRSPRRTWCVPTRSRRASDARIVRRSVWPAIAGAGHERRRDDRGVHPDRAACRLRHDVARHRDRARGPSTTRTRPSSPGWATSPRRTPRTSWRRWRPRRRDPSGPAGRGWRGRPWTTSAPDGRRGAPGPGRRGSSRTQADHTGRGPWTFAGYVAEVVARVRAIDATFTSRPGRRSGGGLPVPGRSPRPR